MAGKGDGEGEGNLAKLENQIVIMKYMLLFTNMIIWVSFRLLLLTIFLPVTPFYHCYNVVSFLSD